MIETIHDRMNLHAGTEVKDFDRALRFINLTPVGELGVMLGALGLGWAIHTFLM